MFSLLRQGHASFERIRDSLNQAPSECGPWVLDSLGTREHEHHGQIMDTGGQGFESCNGSCCALVHSRKLPCFPMSFFLRPPLGTLRVWCMNEASKPLPHPRFFAQTRIHLQQIVRWGHGNLDTFQKAPMCQQSTFKGTLVNMGSFAPLWWMLLFRFAGRC